jgi:hypothetical protein
MKKIASYRFRGISLIESALALVVFGALAALTISYTKQRDQKHLKLLEDRTALRAQAAIELYAIKYGALPCPVTTVNGNVCVQVNGGDPYLDGFLPTQRLGLSSPEAQNLKYKVESKLLSPSDEAVKMLLRPKSAGEKDTVSLVDQTDMRGSHGMDELSLCTNLNDLVTEQDERQKPAPVDKNDGKLPNVAYSIYQNDVVKQTHQVPIASLRASLNCSTRHAQALSSQAVSLHGMRTLKFAMDENLHMWQAERVSYENDIKIARRWLAEMRGVQMSAANLVSMASLTEGCPYCWGGAGGFASPYFAGIDVAITAAMPFQDANIIQQEQITSDFINFVAREPGFVGVAPTRLDAMEGVIDKYQGAVMNTLKSGTFFQ